MVVAQLVGERCGDEAAQRRSGNVAPGTVDARNGKVARRPAIVKSSQLVSVQEHRLNANIVLLATEREVIFRYF